MKGVGVKEPASLVCLFMCLLLTACGLESSVYLEPPKFFSFSPASKTFTFSKTLVNSEMEFRGFELYYKFYTYTINQLTDNNIKDQKILLTKGFRRIASATDKKDDISKPLISIPPDERKGTEFDITVDFSDLTITASSEAISPIKDLRRGGGYDDILDEYKYFDLDEFEIEDEDMNEDVLSAIKSFAKVVLVLYALSFGKKDWVYDIYSEAVYLGEIEIESIFWY